MSCCRKHKWQRVLGIHSSTLLSCQCQISYGLLPTMMDYGIKTSILLWAILTQKLFKCLNETLIELYWKLWLNLPQPPSFPLSLQEYDLHSNLIVLPTSSDCFPLFLTVISPEASFVCVPWISFSEEMNYHLHKSNRKAMLEVSFMFILVSECIYFMDWNSGSYNPNTICLLSFKAHTVVLDP